MTLQEIKAILDAQVIIAPQDPRMELKMACGCDLMSDVLAFAKEESLLLTGLTNLQVVRTAEMANIKALVFVRGKEPDREAIALAMAKKSVNTGLNCSMVDGLVIEAQSIALCFSTEDQKIGMRTFVEKGPGQAEFIGK